MNNVNSKTKKLTISAVFIALYVVIMMCTQSFAFGQYQIRIATALYGVSAIFPFLIIPCGLANIISNTVMGGLGMLDIIGGGLVGILTSGVIVFARSKGVGNWFIWAAVTLVPGLCVPVWLSVLLDIPYFVLASSLLVGQCICGFCSMLLVGALEKVGIGQLSMEGK